MNNIPAEPTPSSNNNLTIFDIVPKSSANTVNFKVHRCNALTVGTYPKFAPKINKILKK